MMQISMELSGSALKRAGQTLAVLHAESVSPGWKERTINALEKYCSELKSSGESTFVFESFRATRSHDLPASHKAWGGIPGSAARQGIILSTGDYRKAKSVKTHAHPVLIWKAL